MLKTVDLIEKIAKENSIKQLAIAIKREKY